MTASLDSFLHIGFHRQRVSAYGARWKPRSPMTLRAFGSEQFPEVDSPIRKRLPPRSLRAPQRPSVFYRQRAKRALRRGTRRASPQLVKWGDLSPAGAWGIRAEVNENRKRSRDRGRLRCALPADFRSPPVIAFGGGPSSTRKPDSSGRICASSTSRSCPTSSWRRAGGGSLAGACPTRSYELLAPCCAQARSGHARPPTLAVACCPQTAPNHQCWPSTVKLGNDVRPPIQAKRSDFCCRCAAPKLVVTKIHHVMMSRSLKSQIGSSSFGGGPSVAVAFAVSLGLVACRIRGAIDPRFPGLVRRPGLFQRRSCSCPEADRIVSRRPTARRSRPFGGPNTNGPH